MRGGPSWTPGTGTNSAVTIKPTASVALKTVPKPTSNTTRFFLNSIRSFSDMVPETSPVRASPLTGHL